MTATRASRFVAPPSWPTWTVPALPFAALAFVLGACASSSGNGGGGTGGSVMGTGGRSGGTGSGGGSTASGGVTGASGGSVGTGGAPASGGVNGSGGNAASSGGATGSGGATASGGTTGSGGRGTAGAPADGGGPDAAGGDGGDSRRDDASANQDGGTSDGRGGSVGSDGATTAALQVLPLGDSITFGFNGSNAGYRGPLFNLLKNAGIAIDYVGSSTQGSVTTTTNPLPSNQRRNEGHSSYTINDINNNLDGLDTATFNQYGGADRDPNGGHWLDGIATGTTARPALYPDAILLMIGTNNSNDSNRTTVKNQLHALIDKITTLRPNTHLLVAQITPSNRPNNVSYNAAVATEVGSFQTAGKRVTLVDMYTMFPSDGLYSDNVHPNDKGFSFMAQQWFDALRVAVPNLNLP